MKKFFAILCLLLPLSTQAQNVTVTLDSDVFANNSANGQVVYKNEGVTWILGGGNGLIPNTYDSSKTQLKATKDIVYTLTFDCDDESKHVVVNKVEVTIKSGLGTTFVITDENGNQGKKTVVLGKTGTAEAVVNSTAGFTFSGDTDAYNIRSITLTYTLEDLPETSLTISENGVEVITPDTYGTVVLDRGFVKGWNTLCLPFSVKASDICEGAVAQKFTGYSVENGLQFSLVTKTVKGGFGGLQDIEVEGEMEANVPYLVWFPEDMPAGKTFKNIAVEAASPRSVEFGGMTFTGNYEADRSMAGLYGVVVDEYVGRIMRGGANTTLRATRAYFDIENQSSGSLSVHMAAFGDDKGQTTAIGNLMNATPRAAATYDLAGRRVQQTKKGLYIVGGRKVWVR